MARSQKRKLARRDGWANVLSGLGTAARDKRLSASFGLERLSYQQLEELYRGDDMAARIVETIPDEMVREWLDVLIEDDQDASERVGALLDEMEVQSKYRDAMCLARAFGGSGILVGANDGIRDTSLPLAMERIRSVDWLTVMDARELVP